MTTMSRFSFQFRPAWAGPETPAGPGAGTGSTPPASGAGGTPSSPVGSAAPSSEPRPGSAQPPVSTPSEGGLRDDNELASDSFDSDSFFGSVDGDQDVLPAPSPVAAAPTSAVPVAVAPLVPEAPPQAPQVPGQTPPAPPAAGPTPDSRLSVGDPRALADALVAQRDEALAHLANTTFKLAPEEIEALETNAVGEIPKLMARAVYQAQVNMLHSMANIVPAMLQQFVGVTRAQNAAQGEFYKRWPQIAHAQHGEMVDRFARSYRAANPTMSRAQMIEDVGAMVMQAAKIAPGAPGSPMAPVGGKGPQPSPFVPASAGVVTHAAPAEEAFSWMSPNRSDE